MKNDTKKIVQFLKTSKDFWLAFASLGLLVYITISYDEWIDPANQSFSARSKGIKLLFLSIDQIGGKWLVIGVFIIAILIYSYSAYNQFKKKS